MEVWRKCAQSLYGGLTVHYAVAPLIKKGNTPRLGDPVDSEPKRGVCKAINFANQGWWRL